MKKTIKAVTIIFVLYALVKLVQMLFDDNDYIETDYDFFIIAFLFVSTLFIGMTASLILNKKIRFKGMGRFILEAFKKRWYVCVIVLLFVYYANFADEWYHKAYNLCFPTWEAEFYNPFFTGYMAFAFFNELFLLFVIWSALTYYIFNGTACLPSEKIPLSEEN